MEANTKGLLTVADGLDLHRLGDLLLGGGQHGPTADFGLEQRVHQSRLAQAALSCKCKHTVSECESKRHTHTRGGSDRLQVSVCTNTRRCSPNTALQRQTGCR